MNRLVIIGNGIAGITTARHVRKLSNREIVIISDESRHFYSRPALMYLFMGHMTFENTKPYEDWFWKKNKLDLVFDRVVGIDTDRRQLKLRDGDDLSYGDLVIATGSRPNYFGWPGQDLKGVQSLYGLDDLRLLEQNIKGTSHAVIVGGGLIGVELAEMLHTRSIDMTFLIREPHYWGNVLRSEEGQMVGRHIEEHHINVKKNVLLDRIEADEHGRVRSVVTDQGEEIACQLVGITAGVHPNTLVVDGSDIQTGRGILVDDFLKTNIDGVYAVGDCAEIVVDQGRNRIEQLWYTGRMQGEVLAKTLCGRPTPYHRGHWFNSAKFFDLEYHTYGYVHFEERDSEASYYWQNDAGTKCFRIVFDKASQQMVGMNAFGLRYRHRVFEQWLQEERTASYVLQHLNKANFDPEFFENHNHTIAALFGAEVAS